MAKGVEIMRILVDADACPVKEIIEDIAKQKGIPVVMFIDTSHMLISNYSEIVTVSKAPDAVDFALINQSQKGDIIVTQDYGVAAMALGRKAFAIHPSGKIYTNENIDIMLLERDIAKRQRRAGEKVKGHSRKRTAEDDERFGNAMRNLCKRAQEQDSMEI